MSLQRRRSKLLACIAVAASLVFATRARAQTIAGSADQFDYDIVIRNGRVLDGAGNPCIFADVAIKNGRFVKLGKIQGHGRTEIDATGRYVSPGWIDMMDQSGIALPKNGLAENKLMEGVTTAIGGVGCDVSSQFSHGASSATTTAERTRPQRAARSGA